jgi:hypothetical protein
MRTLLRRLFGGRKADAIRYRTAPQVVSTEQDGRTVLLDLWKGDHFGVNEVGLSIWQLLGAGATLAEVVDGLEREYAAPREQLERDAERYLALLRKKKLVVRA